MIFTIFYERLLHEFDLFVYDRDDLEYPSVVPVMLSVFRSLLHIALIPPRAVLAAP